MVCLLAPIVLKSFLFFTKKKRLEGKAITITENAQAIRSKNYIDCV